MAFIYDQMMEFFQQDEWRVSPIEDTTIVTTTVSGQNGSWPCVGQVDEDFGVFIFYSAYPETIPTEKLEDMATFITYANYEMLVGNFELSFDDGELRYKTSLNLREIPEAALTFDNLLVKLIDRQVYTNVQTMDRYFPGIEAILNEDVSPEQAIQLIEDADTAPDEEENA